MPFVCYVLMLFHFTPHIYNLGELLKEEGSWTKEVTVSCGSVCNMFSWKLNCIHMATSTIHLCERRSRIMCTHFLLSHWFIPAACVHCDGMNCLLCHKKLILPVRFHACNRLKSIPTEFMSPLVASCRCPKKWVYCCLSWFGSLLYYQFIQNILPYYTLHLSLFWTSISKR